MTSPEKCRACGRELPPGAKQDSPWHPFCSQRCRWVDLARWFNQKYRLAETKGPLGLPDQDRNRANGDKSERK